MNILPTYFQYLINPRRIKALIDQNQELTTKNKAKDKILANISHEIRNPLSAIIGASTLLKENFKNNIIDLENLEYLSTIEESSQETLDFVQDLLDISQLQSGKFNIDLSEKVDLDHLIQRTVKTSKHLYLRNNVEINLKIKNSLPQINLDKRRMKQILANIISNSVKYSNQSVIIDINASYQEDNRLISISISDNGIGMTTQELKKAIKESNIITSTTPKKVDSFGLGIPLIKYLVEKQNGKITIESTRKVGTTISLSFKLEDH
ncbi:MAG: HAMP domain-containing histidine kinase [Rickettsiales bacterium]|nr:HAMP domain-containing histidine kinase [Rickettsiales bacterium]